MLKDLVDFQKKFEGTWMERVIGFMISEDFLPAPDEQIAENEKIIHELNLFEKALFSTGNSLVDEFNACIKSLPTASNSLSQSQKEKAETLRADCKSMQDFLWKTVRGRLEKDGHDIQSIGIREEYQVVQILQKQEKDPFGMFLEEVLGISVIRCFHNCDECDSYEDCNLPIKKERTATA